MVTNRRVRHRAVIGVCSTLESADIRPPSSVKVAKAERVLQSLGVDAPGLFPFLGTIAILAAPVRGVVEARRTLVGTRGHAAPWTPTARHNESAQA